MADAEAVEGNDDAERAVTATASDRANITDPRQLLTTKQAAELLGISPYTLADYVRKGYITPTRLDGRQQRFRVDVLHEFIDSRTDAAD